MKIFTKVNALPQKIQCHLPKDIILNFIAGFKTTYKPNATIPILWMIVYKNGLLFCNTHKTRGIFKNIVNIEIDSIAIHSGLQFTDSNLKILFKDMNEKDFIVTLPSDINCDDIKRLLEKQGYQVL